MRPASRLAGLVLAAGRSSRAPGFKPLLPLGGTTVIETTLGLLRRAGVSDITVVVGHNAAELLPVLSRLPVRCVLNADYDAGMFSSVVAGVKALPADAEAFFLLPADMPLVRSHTVRLLARSAAKVGADVAYPVFQGERGHPPLIAARLAPAIASWDGDGLRALLARHEASACDVAVVDEGVTLDIDTPDDYRLIVERYAGWRYPSRRECDAILARLAVPGAVVRHCAAVAGVAGAIASRLNRTGFSLDEGLITAAGLLHDLAKGRPDHTRRGARIIKSLGYPAVAAIAAVHHEIAPAAGQQLDEAALIYLADKLVKNDGIVSLDERFACSREKFAVDAAAQAAIAGRQAQARRIAAEVERVLGINLAEVVKTV